MTEATASTRRWRSGQLIGERYRVEGFLAEGSAGEVYSAQNAWTSRQVAVKRLLPNLQSDATVVERFLLEGRIGGRIEHPNIVQVLDMGKERTDGSLFIVQELLKGKSLRGVLDEKHRLSVARAVDVIIPIVGALVAVHQQGIVHRDVKPENIFVLKAPFGQRIPKLLDFGIAKVGSEQPLTGPGSVMGTLGYMSPEQLAGSKDVDRRADVWSVGIVLYEMVAGAHPFAASNFGAAMYKIMHREARELREVVPACPAGLSDIVRRTLRKNRQERQDSMLGLLEELVGWSREQPDEFLRSQVSRHRLSLPHLVEKKFVPRTASSHSTAPADNPHLPNTADHTLTRPSRELASVQSQRESGRVRVVSVSLASKAQPALPSDSIDLGRPHRPSRPEEERRRADRSMFDVPLLDSEEEPESLSSSGLVVLESYAKAATDALDGNDFVTACGAANLLASRAGMDPGLRASMRLLQARACFWLGDAVQQEVHAAEAFGLAPPNTGQRLLAAAELACACSTLGKLDFLLQLVDQFVGAQVGAEVLPHFLVGCCRLGIALQRAGWPEHVKRLLRQVHDDLHQLSPIHPEVRAWTLLLRAELADHAGDHAHSLALTRDAAKAFSEHGDSRWACVCRGSVGVSTMALGGYAEARVELNAAISDAYASKISHVELMRLNLGLAEARGGDVGTGLRRLRSGLASLSDSADWRVRSAGHRYLAEVLLLGGDREEAEKAARASVDLAESPALRAQALAMLSLVQMPRPMEAFLSASQAMGMLSPVGGVAIDEARIRLAYAMSLDALGHGESASDAYAKARLRLLQRAQRISDPAWRSSFLERVPDHKLTLALADSRCPEQTSS